MGWKADLVKSLQKQGLWQEAAALAKNTNAKATTAYVPETEYVVRQGESPFSVARTLLGSGATEQQVAAFAQQQGLLEPLKTGEVIKIAPTYLSSSARPTQDYMSAATAQSALLGYKPAIEALGAPASQAAPSVAPATSQTSRGGYAAPNQPSAFSYIPQGASPSTPSAYTRGGVANIITGINAVGGVSTQGAPSAFSFVPSAASPSTPSVYNQQVTALPAAQQGRTGFDPIAGVAPLSTGFTYGPTTGINAVGGVSTTAPSSQPYYQQSAMRPSTRGTATTLEAAFNASAERQYGYFQAFLKEPEPSAPSTAAKHDQAWQFRAATWVQDTMVRNTLNMFDRAIQTGNSQDLPVAVPPNVFATIASGQKISPDEFAATFGFAFDASVNAWVRGISVNATSTDDYKSTLYNYLRNPSKPIGVYPIRGGAKRGEQSQGAQYNYDNPSQPEYLSGYGGYSESGLVRWSWGFG